jgi:hypothetical protein
LYREKFVLPGFCEAFVLHFGRELHSFQMRFKAKDARLDMTPFLRGCLAHRASNPKRRIVRRLIVIFYT